MAQDHRLQLQRFELKYLVDEAITPWVRDFVSSYLDLDDFGVGRPNLSYPVHSLYLDSDDLQTFQYSINGAKNRFKLRLRYYDDSPKTPVFFEVKARVDNCILKQRCGVRREAVPLLLAGQLPQDEQLLSKEPRHLATLQRFNYLLHKLNARPKAHNTYLREAWVSRHDNSVRVTMDRNIVIEPCFVARAATAMSRPTRVFPESVVLELKFTTRFPNWFEELVRRFNLMQFAAAKYAEGVLLVGESRFHDGDRAFDWEGLAPRVHESTAASLPHAHE
ncbi:MAG: hypothetical protein JWR69_1930 [Pedosphaera sp.]|nr:hypothetical protein [Pedosphaera sp.]